MSLGAFRNALYRAAGVELPQFSIDPTGASNRYLSMAGGDYGTGYSRTTMSISLWIKPDASPPAGTVTLYRIALNGSGSADLQVQYLTNGKVRATANFTSSGGITIDSSVDVSDGAWHHVYVVVDTNAGDSNDRFELYIDGTKMASPPGPSSGDTTSAGGTLPALVAGDGSNNPNCLVYQAAMFDVNIPDISSVYNAGNPVSVRELNGLNTLLDVNGGTVTSDYVLATDWTNNNGVVNSADIP